MEKIKLQISGNQIAVLERPDIITSGTVGLPVVFAFDSGWDNLQKIAVFRAGEKAVALDMKEDALTVPWEVLEKPKQWLYIGVYGTNADGTLAIPTLWAQVAVIHTGTAPEADPARDPALPVWQELRQDMAAITWEKVGAAPAGFGLGENASRTENWNAAFTNGFMRGNSNSPDKKMWYGIVCRDSANNAASAEIAFCVDAGNVTAEARRSRNAAGTWGEWEYVNPPMLEGVEYRTTERWKGKTVYTKLINLSKYINFDEPEDVENQVYVAEGIEEIVDVIHRQEESGITYFGSNLKYQWNISVEENGNCLFELFEYMAYGLTGATLVMKYTKIS